jgi:uncharacterized protein YjiS (DUF1127 family)
MGTASPGGCWILAFFQPDFTRLSRHEPGIWGLMPMSAGFRQALRQPQEPRERNMSFSITTVGFRYAMPTTAAHSGPARWLRLMLRAIQTRRALAAMDDRMLSDIGVSRRDALREARRAPWKLTPPA